MLAYRAIARAFLKRIPWQVWVGLAILAVWYWERDRYGDAREAEGRAAVQAQWDEARAKAKAESERITAKNADTTRKADTDVAINLVQERSNADAFIARGGVRPCPARTNTSSESGSPAVDAGAGALPQLDDVPVVTVLPDDVGICTEAVVKARAWQEWGLGIEANQKPAE